MSDMKQNRVYLDPEDIDESLRQLRRIYDLDAETLEMLRRVMELYPRPVLLYVDEANAPLYSQIPLMDKFTFNLQTDELVLFSRDPMTFIDALVEMAMYAAGFATLMGVDEQWKVEFVIGAWKPVKNRIKRRLGIPVNDEPQWVVGLPPPPDEAPPEDPYPFRTLVSQLDLASFTQMVRLGARDDVEVNFPSGTDPRVIQVYIRVKTAMYQVAEGLTLDDWREFNRRLLQMIQELEEEYQPHNLPVPVWWRQILDRAHPEEGPTPVGQGERDGINGPVDPANNLPAPDAAGPKSDEWNPFAAYLDQLFDGDLPSPDGPPPNDDWTSL